MSLQEVMKSNALAEAVFKALQMRERFRQVTDLRRLYNEVDKLTQGNATPDAFNEVIRNMEKAGLGKFVAGRKNNPDRFKWTDKNIAKNIKEGKLESPEPQGPDLVEVATTSGETKKAFQEAIGTIVKQGPVTYLNIKIPLSIPMDSLQTFIAAIKGLQTN